MATGWKDALMADTGAPWNIPYVEPSDLVRDYPAADEAQALAIAAGLTVAGPAGIGANAENAISNTAFSSTSTSYVDITGLEVTFTPSTDTSRVLIMGSITTGLSLDNPVPFRLMRDSTAIAVGNDTTMSGDLSSSFRLDTPSFMFIDSPATDSPVVYKLQGRTLSGTFFVNRRGSDTTVRGISTLTVIEVNP
jgi:hypothetical protein